MFPMFPPGPELGASLALSDPHLALQGTSILGKALSCWIWPEVGRCL